MRLNVVSVSTGKDSTWTALLALERCPRESLRFVSCDTGNEHEEFPRYIDYLERELGIHIDVLRTDFSQQIADRRMFVANDRRVRKQLRKEHGDEEHPERVTKRTVMWLRHKDHIVARYKATGVPLLDANSGFEPRTFDDEVFARWRPINRGPWRFAYDDAGDRPHVERVMRMLRAGGVVSKRMRVYVLIGNEPVEACLERVREVIAWGGEPHVQPYIKLNALQKRPHVRHDWTPQLLTDVARWANGRVWRSVDFDGYRRSTHNRRLQPEQEGLWPR